MSSGQEAARPEAMRSAAGNVGGLIIQASGALLAFGQPALDPGSFGSIGSSVSSADATLHDREVSALTSVLSVLLGVSSSVQQSADDYQEADAAVVASHSGGPAPAREGPLTWPSQASAALASEAARDSASGGVPTPHQAGSIIAYLASVGIGQLPGNGGGGPLWMAAGSARDLTEWLAESAEHQAQFGVIAVYAGAARGLDDTPSGLRPGDLVSIEPGAGAADQDVILGVVGEDGRLHNHGLLSPDFGGLAEVHVYRPVGEGTAGAFPPGSPGRQGHVGRE